jgi:hypothetical protein
MYGIASDSRVRRGFAGHASLALAKLPRPPAQRNAVSKIFISYRRSDSFDATGRIHDQLNAYFGSEMTFRDIDQLKGGKSFPDELAKALAQSSVMLVVIGPQWLGAAVVDGRSRLEDPADFVRMEIATALDRGIPIIPILVGNSPMPLAKTLPADMQSLSFIHAISIPPGQGFGSGMETLVRQIHEASGIPLENYFGALHDCQRTGLVLVKNNFRSDSTVLTEMETSHDLLVVLNDGRGLLDQNKEILLARLRDPQKSTRLVLLHPKSKFLPVLIEKNRKTLEMQIGDIKRTYNTLSKESQSVERLEIRGHFGFNGFSLTLGDAYAFVSPYLYNESGALPLLKFSSSAPGGIYHQLKADAVELFDKSPSLTEDSFDTGLA